MTDPFSYPLDIATLQRKKRSLRRALRQRPGLVEKRIAVLGGSTTSELCDMLELFLLNCGIAPLFYQSAYNRYFEDVMFPDGVLRNFAPELIYLHTSNVNITRYPCPGDSAAGVQELLQAELGKFTALWDRIAEDYACPVIQNNFELPHFRLLGNLDAYHTGGACRFVAELNRAWADQACQRGNLHLNDINYLSAWFGLERWHDRQQWHSYKYAMSFDAFPHLADSIAALVRALFGLSRKCLVLDLDNTLWGGVIGEDGLEGIRIGRESAEAEAYSEFQHYLKALKERGILLAACSKNDPEAARAGFSHPDSVLSLSDFAAFRANWEPKDQNLRAIARELGIGLDSLVFADDNPAERALVQAQVPEVTVPELGRDVAGYLRTIDRSVCFETISLSGDDLGRGAHYAANAERSELQGRFDSYQDYLLSLEMTAEIAPFQPPYLERISQLANKTNQFNLTTRRYTLGEIKAVAGDERYLALYGRLRDRFGDNGLVSVLIGEQRRDELHIDLWLMSCRVLKRGMEYAMFDALVEQARGRGVAVLCGDFIPSAKNAMVSGLFAELGFEPAGQSGSGATSWRLAIDPGIAGKNQCIKVNP
jgi:FkbH-like protein